MKLEVEITDSTTVRTVQSMLESQCSARVILEAITSVAKRTNTTIRASALSCAVAQDSELSDYQTSIIKCEVSSSECRGTVRKVSDLYFCNVH